MKIGIVAGGTGGHIYPAITLADALKKRGHEIVFFGSLDRMEKDVIPARGYKYIGLNVLSTSGSVINKVSSVISMYKAYAECLKILNGYDEVIGFGNYISVPVIKAAKKLGIKTVLHEQNSLAGKANLFLKNDADLIIGSYEENVKQFNKNNVKILGNPQASKAKDLKKDSKVIKAMGLDPKKKTVVCFMGSLGSSSVEKVLIDYFKELDGSYQVVYATGASHFESVSKELVSNDYLKVFDRIDGINVMNNADLLISRAGATTLAEICAIGMPSILIPSPYVPNNHQYLNAMALVNKKAAMIIEEKSLTKDVLKEKVESIINDSKRLKELGENARLLNNDRVLEDIIEAVEQLHD